MVSYWGGVRSPIIRRLQRTSQDHRSAPIQPPTAGVSSGGRTPWARILHAIPLPPCALFYSSVPGTSTAADLRKRSSTITRRSAPWRGMHFRAVSRSGKPTASTSRSPRRTPFGIAGFPCTEPLQRVSRSRPPTSKSPIIGWRSAARNIAPWCANSFRSGWTGLHFGKWKTSTCGIRGGPSPRSRSTSCTSWTTSRRPPEKKSRGPIGPRDLLDCLRDAGGDYRSP